MRLNFIYTYIVYRSQQKQSNRYHFLNENVIMIMIMNVKITLLCGKTMKAPPPADSTIMAKNFGFTAQNVESQLLLDTRILS